MKVLILGAGIGGLTCAHQLLKQGHDITIIEKEPEVGGLCRSKVINGDHAEYAWHGYGHGYVNLSKILEEIPFDDHKNSTVFDNLVPMSQFFHGRDNGHFLNEQGSESFVSNCNYSPVQMALGYHQMNTQITWKDFVAILAMHIFVRTATPERFEEYRGTSWGKFTEIFSEDTRKWAQYMVATALGLDPQNAETHNIFKILRPTTPYHRLASHPWWCFNGPANKRYALEGRIDSCTRWFEPWSKYLESNGVKILLNTTIESIECKNGRIQCIKIKEAHQQERTVTADFYVNGLSVGTLPKILQGCAPLEKQFQQLAEKSYQIQIQASFMMDKKICCDLPAIAVLPDTPWHLIVRFESSFWTTQEQFSRDQSIREILAVGACNHNSPGILYSKPLTQCTRQEVIDEIWAQMIAASGFVCKVQAEDGTPLRELKYCRATLWDTYQTDSKTSKLTSYEPKFSNNVETSPLLPEIHCPYLANMVHATAYSNTDTPVFSMEAAAEAGKRAANVIALGMDQNDHQRYGDEWWVWKLCRVGDKTLSLLGIPHPCQWLFPN